MVFLFRRAARIAASLTRFSRSAPTKPGVDRAKIPRSTSLAKGLPLTCTPRIASRPRISGLSRITRRSKRPGRSNAGSRTSGRFVAAIRITFVSVSKPSISTSIWFKVCSRSSWLPPRPAPRCRPTASISSTNTIHGECRFAWSKRSRTRLAPTPTNISTNSEPEIEKNGTPASPETAFASKVFPVPGNPTRRTPFGIRAPRAMNFSGSRRNSTTSWSSSLASSTPATSSNVTVGWSPVNIRALDLPKAIAALLLPWACLNTNHSTPPNSNKGMA